MFNKKVEIDFDKLDTLILDKNEEFFLVVNKDGIKFEFLIKRKVSSKNLIIFGSGAYNINQLKPPIFHRYSWSSEIDENVIYYNDPTLYLTDITLAWGYGTKDKHYLEIIYKILEKLMNIMSIEKRKTIIYGSSGGGFMAIMLATFLKGSVALVNNPQVDISKYYLSQIEKLFMKIYPNENVQDIFQRNRDRISVVDMFKREEYIPRIVYYQNIACDFDMKSQFYPFINSMKSLEESIFYMPIDIKLYYNKEENHNPLSKNKTINIIKNQLKINNELPQIIEIGHKNWIEFSRRQGYSLFRYEKKINKELVGNKYEIFSNKNKINILSANKIDKFGYGELYSNNKLYIAIEHRDISENDKFNEADIENYFKNNIISIHY